MYVSMDAYSEPNLSNFKMSLDTLCLKYLVLMLKVPRVDV